MITFIKNNRDEKRVKREGIDEMWMKLIMNPPPSVKKDEAMGFIFAEFNGEKRRTIDNIIALEKKYFGIDVDNNITIQEFIARYNEYEFWLYTTLSHKPEHHKFRVIFKGAIPNYDWKVENNRKALRILLQEDFPFLDKQAIGPERIFYCPYKTKNYQSCHNNGKDYFSTKNNI